ncbi:hypothetical protein DTL42_19985 [Bremerella cremea]|uniref:Uncharacterized protein n=1 Tax=Bremerella cremea TaxID=1031537 RepID=A0A368KPA3_9BACT|nr:hypothetical protein [Bremerella cremea]RCS42112.1 hypothetical protein DTL42_19985 [Bremerella cremea]
MQLRINDLLLLILGFAVCFWLGSLDPYWGWSSVVALLTSLLFFLNRHYQKLRGCLAPLAALPLVIAITFGLALLTGLRYPAPWIVNADQALPFESWVERGQHALGLSMWSIIITPIIWLFWQATFLEELIQPPPRAAQEEGGTPVQAEAPLPRPGQFQMTDLLLIVVGFAVCFGIGTVNFAKGWIALIAMDTTLAFFVAQRGLVGPREMPGCIRAVLVLPLVSLLMFLIALLAGLQHPPLLAPPNFQQPPFESVEQRVQHAVALACWTIFVMPPVWLFWTILFAWFNARKPMPPQMTSTNKNRQATAGDGDGLPERE